MLTLISLYALAPTDIHAEVPMHSQVKAEVSDFAPTGAALEDICVDLPSNFGYRSSDQGTVGSVSRIQDFLISKGYLNSESTGYFGGMTLKAVKNYQLDKGFGATGYVGPYTRAAIKNDSCSYSTEPVPNNPTTSTTNTSNIGSAVTGVVTGRVLNAEGKSATLAFLKCGNKVTNDYVSYSPNQSGDVTFRVDVCKQKGDTVWVSCPIGQVASMSWLSLNEFNGRTISCLPSSSATTANVATSVGNCTQDTKICPGGATVSRVAPSCAFAACPGFSATTVVGPTSAGVSGTSSTCPDGTPRQFVVIGPSTGCEGHTTPVPVGGTSTTCPDGTPRSVVAGGTRTGCEGREILFTLYVSNSQSGPYSQNGTVYNNVPLYTRTTGVSRDNPPKGCVHISGKIGPSSCLNILNYRDFTADEWKDSSTIETVIQDVSNTAFFPLLRYETYLLYPGQTPKMYGTFVLTSPVSGSNTKPASADVYGVCGTAVHTCASGTNGGSTQTSTGWIWYCGGTPNDVNHRSALCSSTPAAFNMPTQAQVLGASITCVNLSRNLHRGMESVIVTQLQSFLQENGIFVDSPTGFYGDKTIEAVKVFQKNQNLTVTGMVYENTREAIRSMTCQ